MLASFNGHRRRLVLRSAVAAGWVSAGAGFLGGCSRSSGGAAFDFQLSWFPGVQQAGEVVAQRLGYYAEEGLDVRLKPGGPNFDGIANVASGQCPVGQASSSPSIMLAVSQGLPIRCFAVGAQRHPYCFFSLARNPVRRPADLVGKRVGLQPTGAGLLRALLLRNGIAEKDVEVVPIGVNLTPLLTGQVDVATGWLTNTSLLEELGPDRVEMPLWDAGVRLYGLPYYANAELLRSDPRPFERFLRATARGWIRAYAHRDEAVALLVEAFPGLRSSDQRSALDAMLHYGFSGLAATQGWGAMEASNWQDQIGLYARLSQFGKPPPSLADVMTLDLLAGTRSERLRT